jgi:hypothetical protein
MATAQYVPAQFAVPAQFHNELIQAADLVDASAAALSLSQSVLNGIGTNGIDSEYKAVTYFIFAKALKTANAVQILCRTGFGSDGLALCAVLFENLVDLLYIGASPKRRATRYFQFENVEKYFQAQKILSYARLPKGRRNIYRRYESDLLPQVCPLLKYFPKKTRGWSQKSIYERAKEIKAGLAYQELYWIFCAHKHTLPMSAIATTEITATGDALAITGPHIKGICDSIEQSASMLLQICMTVDRVFTLSLRSQIETCLVDLSNAVAAVRRAHPILFS